MKTRDQIIEWFNTPGHVKCTLLDIDQVYIPGGSTSGITLNFSSMAYDTGGTAYNACVVGGLQFSEQLNADGRASLSFCSINLVNTYGINDQFLTYVWNRRPIKIYLGDPSWVKSDFVLIFDGLVQELTSNGENELVLTLFDKLQLLNDSLTEKTLFNTTGYSEASKTIAGGVVTKNESLLPITLGECFNVQPLLVDNGTTTSGTSGSGNSYMVHDGPIQGIIEVRDNGVPIPVNENLTVGTFTLQSLPVGTITCSVQGDNTAGAYTNTVPGIITKICTSTKYGTIAQNRFNTSDLDFSTTDTRAAGIYIKDKVNMLEICNQLASSINASLICPSISVNYTTGAISSSKLRLVELKVPDPLDIKYELTDDYLVAGTQAVTEIFPVKPSIKLAYCKNFTIQSSVAGGVNPASKFDDEYIYSTKENLTNKQIYRDAGTVDEISTLLIVSSQAETEAQKRLDLWQIPRFLITGTYLPHFLFAQLGDTVKLTSSRFNLQTGAPGIVYSVNRDWITGMVQIGVLI